MTFYIMKAIHISNNKVSISKILENENDCTIIAATRHSPKGPVPCFIVGSQGNYKVKNGDVAKYTIDTGNGYREKNSLLDIEDIININDHHSHSNFGRRYVYVMK